MRDKINQLYIKQDNLYIELRLIMENLSSADYEIEDTVQWIREVRTLTNNLSKFINIIEDINNQITSLRLDAVTNNSNADELQRLTQDSKSRRWKVLDEFEFFRNARYLRDSNEHTLEYIISLVTSHEQEVIKTNEHINKLKQKITQVKKNKELDKSEREKYISQIEEIVSSAKQKSSERIAWLENAIKDVKEKQAEIFQNVEKNYLESIKRLQKKNEWLEPYSYKPPKLSKLDILKSYAIGAGIGLAITSPIHIVKIVDWYNSRLPAIENYHPELYDDQYDEYQEYDETDNGYYDIEQAEQAVQPKIDNYELNN